MSKKFRQEEPVQTQQGNGRIVGERNGSGPVTKWVVELEDGETGRAGNQGNLEAAG